MRQGCSAWYTAAARCSREGVCQVSAVRFREQFIEDDQGNRIAVVISPRTYEMLLEALEELESIRAYDEAVSSHEESIPFDQALAEIRSARR